MDQHGFVLFELLDVTVQGLDLVLRLLLHILNFLQQDVVVHFEVTFVADSDHCWVILRQLPLVFAADFADRASTALAVALQVSTNYFQLVREGCLAELAGLVLFAILVRCLDIKIIG